MDWVGTTNKFYIDQQLPNYQQIANAVAARFPHLRVGIGPAVLNERYLGTDKQQIEDFIVGFGVPLHGLRTTSSHPSPNQAPKPESSTSNAATTALLSAGAPILVLMEGIGPVEARFVRTLPTGKILIDLDGIEEEVDASSVRLEAEAPSETRAPATPPAEPVTESLAPPEAAASLPASAAVDVTPPQPAHESPRAPDLP